MSTLTKTVLATLAAMLVAGAAYAATTPGGESKSSTTTPAAADVKGPCDEAEHANDPRCAGAQVPEDRPNNADRRGDRNLADDDHAARHENEGSDPENPAAEAARAAVAPAGPRARADRADRARP